MVLAAEAFGHSLHVYPASDTCTVDSLIAALGAGGLTGGSVVSVGAGLEDAFIATLARSSRESREAAHAH
jgi:hypothetical protein